MKIAVEDLEKALKWIKANSPDLQVRIEPALDGRNMAIKCQDRYESQVEITLFNESLARPKIKKEDQL